MVPFLVVIVLLGAIGSSIQQTDERNQCQTLLEASWKSFENEGLDTMITTIAEQYETFPSGPYVYCYDNIQQDQKNALDMARFVHPYLTLNETIQTTVKGLDAANAQMYQDSYQNASLKVVEDCCGDIFNYTLNFNQSQSETSAGQAVPGSLRNYLGFGGKYNGGYILCGCPITDIPPGNRNNVNAAVLLSQASTAGSIHSRFVKHVLFIFVVLLFVH